MIRIEKGNHMKNRLKRTTAALLALMTVTAVGCGYNDSGKTDSDSKSASAVSSDKDVSESEKPAPDKSSNTQESYTYVQLLLGGESYSFSDDQKVQLTSAVSKLKAEEFDDLTVYSDCKDWDISLSNDRTAASFMRSMTSEGWRIIDSDMNCYADSPELSEIILDIASSNTDIKGSTEKEYYSVECDEPSTEEEYTAAAVACTKAWLTSLQSEDTDEYYRNKSFEITLSDESGRQKCNYLSCGTVNGKKEFVVEICFTAEDYGADTFYDDYYQEGRYTEAGTFWSGQYICGRYRWENGKCTLINMTARDGSEGIQQGLNGIQSGEYKNFYEFARRSDYDKAVKDSFTPYGSYTVSKNLTQTEDGKAINVDIYAHSIDDEDDNTYTAIWDERAYIDGQATYSTGFYFTDGGTGHMPDTLPKDFKLTFDNYDGDANPDFCVRYDSDEQGTFYVLDSVQTDGRIFNLSGRAFESGIYIAGCKEASPRLQKTDDIAYVGWKIDNGRYYPTDENGNETKLPELNMYSDRYYLPDSLKMYSEDENNVTCFLWNNTDKEITTDSSYSIEICKAGEWKPVAKDLSAAKMKVAPREYAEITYDISTINKRCNALYRIVQNSGSLTAYGNFCLQGKAVNNLTVSAEDMYIGALCGTFTVKDNGFEKTEIRSAVIKNGDTEYPLNINWLDEDKYTFFSADLPDKPGEYKLTVNEDAECTLRLKELSDNEPQISISPKIKAEGSELSVTPNTDCELSEIYVFRKTPNGWQTTGLTPDGSYDTELKSGKTYKINLINYYSELLIGENLEYLYESFKDYIEEEGKVPDEMTEMGLAKNSDINSFKNALIEYFSIDNDGEYMTAVSWTVDEKKYQRFVLVK